MRAARIAAPSWGARALRRCSLRWRLIPQVLHSPHQFRPSDDRLELIGQHRDHAMRVLSRQRPVSRAPDLIAPPVTARHHGARHRQARNHILSTDRVRQLHTPIAWNPRSTLTTPRCAQLLDLPQRCDGTSKGPTHIVTDLECDACHTTLTWAGASSSHKTSPPTAASCHNGCSGDRDAGTHIPVGTPDLVQGCNSTTNFTTWAARSSTIWP